MMMMMMKQELITGRYARIAATSGYVRGERFSGRRVRMRGKGSIDGDRGRLIPTMGVCSKSWFDMIELYHQKLGTTHLLAELKVGGVVCPWKVRIGLKHNR